MIDDIPERYPLVRIDWWDSPKADARWTNLAEFAAPPCGRRASVGWLIEESDGVKVLAQNFGGFDNFNTMIVSGIVSIQKTSIISTTKLKLKE